MKNSKTQTIKLIDGEFSATEAMEIILNVFSSKVKFHQMKNFSSMVRFGKEDKIASKRIPQLLKSIESISKMIKESGNTENVFNIKSDVIITVSKSKK